jgi:PAS domain S-box-containing protein
MDKYSNSDTVSKVSNPNLRKEAEKIVSKYEIKSFDSLPSNEVQQLLHELQVHQIELEMQNEELRTIQGELNKARELYIDLYDLAPVGYCSLDAEDIILHANLTAATLLETTKDVLLKRSFSAFIFTEDQDIYYLFQKGMMEKRIADYCVLRMVKKDGRAFWAHVAATAATMDDRIQLQIVFYDMTKNREADEKLRVSAQIHQGILETTLDGFWSVDFQGNLIDVNSTYCQQSGYTRDELLSMQISQLDAIECPLKIKERMNMIINHKRVQFETKHRRKDESIWDVEISITYCDIGGGRFFAFIRDITERKKMEEALNQTEKMLIINSRQAAMGEMISMIAHQWRQPLNIMGLAMANLQTKQALNILAPTELEDKFNIISSNISYMSETIDDFRDFFKPNQSKEQITIGDVIKSTFDIIGKTFKNENITIRVDNNTHRSLLLYKNKLIQVILNLLNNARYILISKKVKDAAITITVHETEDAVTIAICDNAGGISKKSLAYLGEPYFTTKELNGTGLGLYILRTSQN